MAGQKDKQQAFCSGLIRSQIRKLTITGGYRVNVLISTWPFGEIEKAPLNILGSLGVNYTLNPFERKMKEEELAELIGNYEILIAGTEPITSTVLAHAKNLKLICRVGIGLDSVDLVEARNRNIAVSYTPDAPSAAVTELTIGLIFTLLRFVHTANIRMHQRKWNRFFGKRLADASVGVIGAGRIGTRVAECLSSLGCREILIHDCIDERQMSRPPNIKKSTKREILSNADVISLHVPRTVDTIGLIGEKEIAMMRKDAFLINTARGGIVNERALIEALSAERIAGAAIDVFEDEPFTGELATFDSCILTSHMGSMSVDCRARMEVEATEEAQRWILGIPLLQPVPDVEYQSQMI